MRTETKNDLKAIGLSVLALFSAAVAVNLGGTLALRAQDGATDPRVGGAAATAPRPGSAAGLSAGDRIKISFYELIDLRGEGQPARGTSGADQVLRTYYQRMDMSSEHTLDQDGVVWLPRLGSFQALGRSPIALQAELAAAFRNATGRSADVGVAVLERRPIYIVGPVRNPGAVRYVPDMMVLHAVALAGGMDRGAASTAEMIEAAREAERVNRLTDRLSRLLARAARLEAERSGVTEMQPSPQLIALAGDGRAETLLASERALLGLEHARRTEGQSEAAINVLAARKEVDALRAKLRELETQSQIRDEHLQEMQRLKTSGLTTRRGIVVTRTEVAEIQGRKLDLGANLALAEARLAQAERVRVRQSYDQATELVRAIAATEAEIAEVRLSLEAAGHLSVVLGQRVAPALASARPSYEIVRNGKDGPVVIGAEETSTLAPGDVLRISLEITPRARAISGAKTHAGHVVRPGMP